MNREPDGARAQLSAAIEAGDLAAVRDWLAQVQSEDSSPATLAAALDLCHWLDDQLGQARAASLSDLRRVRAQKNHRSGYEEIAALSR